MARSYYFITIVLLLFTSLAARPIKVAKFIGYSDNEVRDTTDVLVLATKKIGGSGPSSGGEGHKLTTVGDIKNSGPSPGGKGHASTNDNILGDIKNSGPSPGGKGHESSAAESLGNIKNSGPSPGGKGHGFPDAESLGNIKNSGPSEFPSNVATLGNILNSGSNHGGQGGDESRAKMSPWLGAKRHSVIIYKNLWNQNNSGPSPGEGH